MNDIFNFFSPLSFVKSGTVAYKPYINYSWSQPLTVGGNQQIKDIGTAGLNLQQFFGQGVSFNGIDQNIVLETTAPAVTSPIWTICFNVNTESNNKYIVRLIGGVLKVLWFNGGLTYYNGSANIKLDTTNSNRAGSYVVKSDGSDIYTYLNNVLISTISQAVEQLRFGLIRDLAGYNGSNLYLGILKDVYLFKKSLSETEINNYFNQPNQFFMDSLEDNSCILAMPMCEKDNYVRNYKSYSYSSFLINNIGLKSSTHSGTRIAQLDAGLLVQAGKTYLIKYSFIGNANITNFKAYIPPTANGGRSVVVEIPVTNTNNGVIVTIPTTYTTAADGFYCWLVVNGTSISVNFDEASIREINGIYPITNYLTTCRTNAQRLPYGLQTSGFKRDSNGLILSKSNFLEADGVGYGNTGNYIDSLTDFSIEFVGLFKTSSTEQAHGVGYSNAYNRITFSINSSGKLFSRCGGAVVNYSTESFFDVSKYLTLTFVQSTKIFKLYLNGNYVGQISNVNFISTVMDYTIGAQGSTTYAVNGDIRLFKVHNKVLTQEEVSKNFNKYQAQGLLNE